MSDIISEKVIIDLTCKDNNVNQTSITALDTRKRKVKITDYFSYVRNPLADHNITVKTKKLESGMNTMNTSGESKWSSELVLNNEPEEQENGIPISMEDHTLLRSQSFPISYQLTEQEPAKTTESDEPSKKRSMKNCDEDCPLPKTKKNVEPEYGFQIFERLKKKLDLKISLKNDEMMTYDEYHRRHGVNIFKDKNFDPVVDLMSRVDSLVEDFNEESESSFVDTPVEDAEPECPLTGTLLSTIMQARYPK